MPFAAAPDTLAAAATALAAPPAALAAAPAAARAAAHRRRAPGRVSPRLLRQLGDDRCLVGEGGVSLTKQGEADRVGDA